MSLNVRVKKMEAKAFPKTTLPEWVEVASNEGDPLPPEIALYRKQGYSVIHRTIVTPPDRSHYAQPS